MAFEAEYVCAAGEIGVAALITATRGSDMLDECWQRNMAALASCHPDLHRQAMQEKDAAMALSCPFLAEEPWAGVDAHLQTVETGAQGLVVFLGMGMGHGPLLVQRERPDVAQFAILEPSLDLFCRALATVNLVPLLSDSRVVLFVGEIDFGELENAIGRVAALEDTHILRHVPSFHWRPALYASLNDRAYMLLNQLNTSGSTVRQCGQTFMGNRFASLTMLRHANSIDALRDRLAGQPAVVVAAGPSLQQSLPALKGMTGRCVIIAADSALAPLLKAGIVPDIVTTIDYLDLNFEKIAPFVGQEWPFSLVSLAKATPMVAKRLAVRHLFLAFADDLPQRWVVEALGVKTLAPACSSVAHLSLGTALILGCSPIVFVGQDLSYTDSNLDHVDGTIIMRRGLPKDREIFTVPALGGGTVPTDRQFLNLIKIFEDVIGGWPRRYINASAAGARIRGTEELPLDEVFALFGRSEVAVGLALDEAVVTGPGFEVENFVRVATGHLRLVKRLKQRVEEVLVLGESVRRRLASIVKSPKKVRSVRDLPGPLYGMLSRFDSINNGIDAERPLWEQMVELTFAMLSENDRWRLRNDRSRERDGYLPWLVVEIERINRLNQDRFETLNRYGVIISQLLDHLAEEEKFASQTRKGREAILALASLHLQAHDYLLAERTLRLLPEETRSEAAALQLAGEARAGMLDFAGARICWQQAVEYDPSLATSVEERQNRFCEEWLGFVERYANVGEGGDNFPHLLPVWLQRIIGAAGGRDKAIALARPVFDRQCDKLERLLEQSESAEAEAVLLVWRPLFEDDPRLLLLLARCHAVRKDHDGAARWAAKAVAVDPGGYGCQFLLIRSLLAAGRFQEAVFGLDAAVKSVPSIAMLWGEIGDLLLMEDPAGAVIAYEKCFLLFPAQSDSLLKMGHGYRLAGDLPAAAASYEAFLRQQPDNAEARGWLTAIRQDERKDSKD